MPLPFGLKLKRTRRYTVSSKSCLVARIQLLNNEFVEFTLSVESTGQESLEAVAQRLELRERESIHLCLFTVYSLWKNAILWSGMAYFFLLCLEKGKFKYSHSLSIHLEHTRCHVSRIQL
uniref:FERM N-terminal domain-containing protein n=1 Tax=Pavo cristatus TaxID=9049 RepID=A0A8C9FSZ7_PAVCR